MNRSLLVNAFAVESSRESRMREIRSSGLTRGGATAPPTLQKTRAAGGEPWECERAARARGGLPEAAVVHAYGGRVAYLPLVPDVSRIGYKISSLGLVVLRA